LPRFETRAGVSIGARRARSTANGRKIVAEQFERVAKRKGSPQRVRKILSEFYREHYGHDLPFASVRK
jgi:hypothetical protein